MTPELQGGLSGPNGADFGTRALAPACYLAQATMNNRTIPTTIGALLTEEYTIDPLSSLPSFLELTFVDVARNSGRRALALGWRVGLAWLEGALARLRQLERLATRRAARSQSNGSSPSSRALGVVRAIAIGLRRARARCLRRACQLFLRTMTAFGPELQALLMFAIDYHCLHYVAGATACEMVYGLKRSRVVREPPPPRSRRASGAPAAVALPLSKPGAGGAQQRPTMAITATSDCRRCASNYCTSLQQVLPVTPLKKASRRLSIPRRCRLRNNSCPHLAPMALSATTPLTMSSASKPPASALAAAWAAIDWAETDKAATDGAATDGVATDGAVTDALVPGTPSDVVTPAFACVTLEQQ